MKDEVNVNRRDCKQELLGVGVGHEQGQRWEGTHFVQGAAMSPAISTGGGVSLRSSKHPPDDHRPQMAPVYSGGCRTGRRRHRAAPGFLLYSCSHGNSPRRLFIQLSSVSFPSTPPDSPGAKKEFYWALRESPQA